MPLARKDSWIHGVHRLVPLTVSAARDTPNPETSELGSVYDSEMSRMRKKSSRSNQDFSTSISWTPAASIGSAVPRRIWTARIELLCVLSRYHSVVLNRRVSPTYTNSVLSVRLLNSVRVELRLPFRPGPGFPK